MFGIAFVNLLVKNIGDRVINLGASVIGVHHFHQFDRLCNGLERISLA